jgi:hypothetical protein
MVSSLWGVESVSWVKGKPDAASASVAAASGARALGGRSVFISYRRKLSERLALLVRNNLIEHHFDTFMDIQNLDSGEFGLTILRQIGAREHFIVLLEPGSLDHIGDDGDWMRREIAFALAYGRNNVVPVTAGGFEFRRDLVLPPDVARLPSFQAASIPKELQFFETAMEMLRTQFLKIPSSPAAPPPPEIRRFAPGSAREALYQSNQRKR